MTVSALARLLRENWLPLALAWAAGVMCDALVLATWGAWWSIALAVPIGAPAGWLMAGLYGRYEESYDRA